MTTTTSPPLRVRARGPLAIFTEPAFSAERVSVPVMTPTAACGLLSAILWKPAFEWTVERIHVLAPIRFTSFRRNEVKSKAAVPSAALVRDGGTPPVLYADDDRSQRNTVALQDVDYVIDARFTLTGRAGPSDSVPKFVDMFRRRVEKGQHFSAPFLGTRECAADVLPADGAPPAIAETRRLGRILHAIDYRADGTAERVHFFEAELIDGVMHVPPRPSRAVA